MLRDRLVKAVGSGLVETFKQVAVLVQDCLDRTVAESLSDGLWVFALGDQQRNIGVSEIVEAQRLADRRSDSRQLLPVPEVSASEWASVAITEHPSVPCRESTDVVAQLVGD